MTSDRYGGFAERYDLFFVKFDEHDSAVIEFYRRLFEQNRVRTVLDCACGTGRDLFMFRSLGLDAYGSDISDAMLAQARKNLAAQGMKVPILKADYRELPRHFRRKFDAVVCLSTAIGELPDETEALRAFMSMRRVLREGGLLILTQGTSDRQWREKPRFIPAINNREFSRIFVIDYQEKGARYNILDVFHSEQATDFKVWSIEYLQILLRDDMERLLRESGFSKVDFYGTYGFEPYIKETSNRLIAVATK